MMTRCWQCVLGTVFAVLFAMPAFAAERLPLTILHFNDFHGQLEPFEDRFTGRATGGIARLIGAIRSVRAEEPRRPVLVLFAGDMLQGTVTSTVFLGVPDLEFFAAAGVDVAVMGNHELDFGQDHFRKLLARARFPILAANVHAQPEPFAVRPSVILPPSRRAAGRRAGARHGGADDHYPPAQRGGHQRSRTRSWRRGGACPGSRRRQTWSSCSRTSGWPRTGG